MFKRFTREKHIFAPIMQYNFFSCVYAKTIADPELRHLTKSITPISQISHHIASKYNRIFTERSFQKLNSWFVEFYVRHGFVQVLLAEELYSSLT